MKLFLKENQRQKKRVRNVIVEKSYKISRKKEERKDRKRRKKRENNTKENQENKS